MNRRVNFLSILVLLAFSIIFSIAIHAQDKLRLSRPVESETNHLPISSSNNTGSNPDDDNSSAFRINLPASRSHGAATIKSGIEQENQSGNLTQVQLQKLAAHDIILLIDKSGSMSTPDCAPKGSSGLKSILPSLFIGGSLQNSRWHWCQQQTAEMSALTQQVLPNGFSVLLFDSNFSLFPHVTSDNLARIFASNNPGGSTNLTLPLGKVFDDYFHRKRLSKIKPLLVGIITDGCPDDPYSVRKLLVKVSQALSNPNEITIVFFLIGGHDAEGEKFARDLSRSVNLVRSIPFNEVQSSGLARALADNLE